MMNRNEFGRKRSWTKFKVLFQYFPGVTEENHEKIRIDALQGWDLNPGPSKYEAGMMWNYTDRRKPKKSENNLF
jgi:hypothetical protein